MDWHSDVHTVARSGACTEDQLDVEDQMRQVAFDTYNMHEFSNHSILLKTVNPHRGTVDVCVCVGMCAEPKLIWLNRPSTTAKASSILLSLRGICKEKLSLRLNLIPVTPFSPLYHYKNMSIIHSITDFGLIRPSKYIDTLLRPASRKQEKWSHFRKKS